MRNLFRKKQEPSAHVHLFELLEEKERLSVERRKEAEAAEERASRAQGELLQTIKKAHEARAELDQSIAGARRQSRGVGGRTW